MSKIEQMFDFQGKTTKLIGSGEHKHIEKFTVTYRKNKMQMNYQFMKIILEIMN